MHFIYVQKMYEKEVGDDIDIHFSCIPWGYGLLSVDMIFVWITDNNLFSASGTN